MATFTSTIALVLRSVLAAVAAGRPHEAAHVVPLVETPTGGAVNVQANASGHQYVEVATAALPTGAATAALQTTLNGYVQPGTWTPATAAAAADSGIISASACTVRDVVATNAHSSARYLMLFDSATVPADTTAPRIPAILVPATTTIRLPIGALVCSNGLSWAMSSTQSTKTVTSDTLHVCSAEII